MVTCSIYLNAAVGKNSTTTETVSNKTATTKFKRVLRNDTKGTKFIRQQLVMRENDQQ